MNQPINAPLKPTRVGLLGMGTVGGGTYDVLRRNHEEISRRAFRPIEIVAVADLDIDKIKQHVDPSVYVTSDAFSIVDDPSIDVIVELIGGTTIAKELVLKAICNGKHVVTANKALLAKHGNEIFKAALEKGVMVAFLGTDGSGKSTIISNLSVVLERTFDESQIKYYHWRPTE